MTKKLEKFINVGIRPVIIVGEKMGRQRIGQDTYALEGNGTGDFVHEAIEDLDNIILTNVNNHYYKGDFDHNHPGVREGLSDLFELFLLYEPVKIICLGNIAYNYVAKVKKPDDCPVISFRHPSWINRFKRKTRHLFLEELRNEILEKLKIAI
jgi:hypothetical protein